jgi:nitroimidazol reductase NimA-like FMN-containing flavoprotein (pyridoxamine 5'-phosphate oxidase superfamily)
MKERCSIMLDRVTQIIQDNDICVLATAGADGPHTSLMAYAGSGDYRVIYLATPRNTRKYRNLCAQPRVSLMVDTRDKDPRGEVKALTIDGAADEIRDAAEADSVRNVLLGRHPHLQSLLEQPDIAFIRVVIAAVQMLSGPLEAGYVRFPAGDAG